MTKGNIKETKQEDEKPVNPYIQEGLDKEGKEEEAPAFFREDPNAVIEEEDTSEETEEFTSESKEGENNDYHSGDENKEEPEAPKEKNFVRDLDNSDIGSRFLIRGKEAKFVAQFGMFEFEEDEEREPQHVPGDEPIQPLEEKEKGEEE